ncbi:hypothetical protein BGZ47_002704, partial [Haplosporangium gracile]
MDKVKEPLSGNGQVMLILGDSGAGKSTFNRHLENELWQDYKPGDRELEQSRQLLLICDDYDESQLTTNLHTTSNFNRSGQQDIKLLITCRTQYLGPDYRDRFAPKALGEYYRPANELFHEAVIVPFSNDQIEQHVEKYVPFEPRTWITKDYMDRLTTIPNLMDLVKNPFLLILCLEALPMVAEGKTDLSSVRVTRVQLYDIFVNHWLGINKRRLQEQKLSDSKQEALETLLADVSSTTGLSFRRTWQQRSSRSKMPVESLWQSVPFVHRSVPEYFFSCIICDPVGEKNADADIDITLLPNGNHPLSQRHLVAEPSIIQFLAERVQTDSGFKQHLLALIELSKSSPQASQAAANAISILIRADERFNGADISGGQFDSTKLQDADLKGVNLTKTWIRQVDFSGASMDQVRFGELPYLRETQSVNSCAFSPDGRTFATGLSNRDISVYNTSTWMKDHTLQDHHSVVTSLAFSPNGQQLVSGSWDHAVLLWNCETQAPIYILERQFGYVSAVAFSPSGKQVELAGKDKSVRLWDVETGETVFVLTGYNNVNTVAYSSNGNSIASGDQDGVIRVFDTDTGQLILVSSTNNQEIL